MNLIVAFDGSAGAEAALTAAARLARAAGGRLLLLHVLNPLVDAADVVAPTRDEAMRVVTAAASAALAARVAAIEGVPAETLVVPLAHGEDVPGCIDRVAEERGAELVVIASRRAAGLRGLALGSVTQQLLRTSRRPVMVVHA